MINKWNDKKSGEEPRKLKLGHNMTTAEKGLGRPILEGRYCGIRELPDFMEIETTKDH